MNLDFKKLDSIVNELKDLYEIPGVSLGIIKDGEIHTKSYGYRDVKNKLPVNEETIFSIGSITKSFTAASLALLVSEGKIKWEDKAKKHYPALQLYDKDAEENLSIHDILCHCSGLAKHEAFSFLNRSLTPEELVKRLVYLKPIYPVGKGHQYQNMMYTLAGVIIESVTKMPWDEFIQDNFTEPLNMPRTIFSSPKESEENKALPYSKEGKDLIEIPYFDEIACTTAGAMYSSIIDMLKWISFQLNTENKEILECHAPKAYLEKPTKAASWPELSKSDYGYGWYTECYRGQKVIFHDGSVDGFYAKAVFLPHHNSGFVILTNAFNGSKFLSTLHRYICDMLLDAQETNWIERFKAKKEEAIKFPPILSPQPDVIKFKGTYKSKSYGEISFEYIDGYLYTNINNVKSKARFFDVDKCILSFPRWNIAMPIFFVLEGENVIGFASPLEPKIEPIFFQKV